ncbi:MAG: hypothetical protein WDN23_14890 [Edaphobacter sp.]
MIGNYSARLTGSTRNLLALLASSVIFSAGCANMSTTAPASNPLSTAAALSGKVHGGNQPISGATITLWYAGQSGSAVQAAQTTTDNTGSFSFVKDPVNGNPPAGNVYSCPSNSDPLVYVVSKGGNTANDGTDRNNTAAAFVSIYGTCRELSAANFVYMSEVTTAATMAAMQQFFDPVAETFSADGTGQQKGIIDGVNQTVALLASSSTGQSVPSTTLGPATNSVANHNVNINPSVSVTAVPESVKLNTIANIISACVNGATSADPSCTSLFTAAVPPTPNTTSFNPPSFSAPTDTLQALYYMFTNPGSGSTTNMTTLLNLSGGVGAPYQPSLATAPTDWSIGIYYSSSSTCGTPTGGTGAFFSSPTDVAIDSFNNVWVANSQTAGNLAELASNGAPATCINLDPGAAQSIALDSNYGVWVGAGSTMYRYTPGGLATGNGLPGPATLPFPASGSPLAVTADGVGNVYFTSVAGSTGSLYQLVGAATAPSIVAPLQIATNIGTSPLRAMPDFRGNATQGNIWVTSGTTSVSQVAPGIGPDSLNGFITTPILTANNSYGVSVSHSNNIYVSAVDTGAITKLTFNGTNYEIANGWPFGTIGAATSIATDGRDNVWIPNETNGTGVGNVNELSNAPAFIAPAATGIQKSSLYLNSSTALAVDQAGNVWVVGNGNSFITEIVGSGVPVYTPYAVGLKNGRFQTIP